MLAYVFWHWKQRDVTGPEYERRQRAFHAALNASPSAGLRGSFSVGLSHAPWAAGGEDAYEDWYLVEDFGALGRLNEAAVSGGRAAPHDAAAAVAAGGAGGVYRLRSGSVVPAPRYAHWFGKPDGVRYADLLAELSPLVDQARGGLWMRQMVLGPAREFCLHAPAPVGLPDAFGALVLSVRPVWAGPTGG
jgi:hypothetical protein